MWILEEMAASCISEGTVVLGEMTGGQDAHITVQGETEYRHLALVAPWGIAYLPPARARVAILGGAGNPVCAGTVAEAGGLEPDELLLSSADRARIYLENSGEVVASSQTFSAAGGS